MEITSALSFFSNVLYFPLICTSFTYHRGAKPIVVKQFQKIILVKMTNTDLVQTSEVMVQHFGTKALNNNCNVFPVFARHSYTTCKIPFHRIATVQVGRLADTIYCNLPTLTFAMP